MKKFLFKLLTIISCILSLSFIIIAITAYTQGNIPAGIIVTVITVLSIIGSYTLIKKNRQYKKIDTISINNEVKEQKEPIQSQLYKPVNLNSEDISNKEDINNKNEEPRTINKNFIASEPLFPEEESYYEMFQLFKYENLSLDEFKELNNRIITLYARYFSVPLYFQDVEYIKKVIENQVAVNRKEYISVTFLKQLIKRNNVLIDAELEKEEVNLYKLKTKKGRLNRISRIKDNFYLYSEYLSKSNLSYLDEKLDELKARFRLDEDELVQQ